MRWIDGSIINIKQFTGETLCEKLAAELWDIDYDQWLNCADFIQAASFIIAFDTELTMEGIFSFLENSIGHYAPHIIKAFRTIGDNNDADTLEEICRLASPDIIRDEYLNKDCHEYDLITWSSTHKTAEELEAKILKLSGRLYLNNEFDIWPLLFSYLDEQIKKL